MSDYAPWDDDGVYKYDEAEFERAKAEYEAAEQNFYAEQCPLIGGFGEYNTEAVSASTLDEYLMFLVKGYINVGLRSGLSMHLMDLLEDEWFYQWPLIHWAYASSLLRGIGCKKDIKSAVDILLPMAGDGCPGALYDIGCCYMNGWGVEESYTKAIYCWLKAWDNGYHQAKDALKLEYKEGRFNEHEEVPAYLRHVFVCKILHWFMTEKKLTEKNLEEQLSNQEKKEFKKLDKQIKQLEKELVKEAPFRESAKLFYDDDNNPYKVKI